MFVVAHRTPATPAACAALVEAGVSCFELDIQLSARGVVVSHFLPLLGVRGWIENDNWRFRWRSARDPLVSEVLACIPDGVDVLLDPKETEASRRADLVRRVAELPDRERYVVSTSALDDLVAYRAAGLRTWRTLKNVRQLRAALRSGPLEDEGVSVRHALLDARTLNQLHAVVPSVVGWTVNDLDRARSLYQWGIDGITTDRPEEITRISRS